MLTLANFGGVLFRGGVQAEADQGVPGTSSDISDNVLEGAAADAAEAPNRVDAGADGVVRDLASSPVALMIAGLGILIAMAGAMARRRTGAAHTS